MNSKAKSPGSSKAFTILIVLLFLTGASILLYPTVSNMWNEYRNQQLQTTYKQSVENLGEDAYKDILARAREYNSQHTVNTVADAFDENNEYELSHPYDTLLNPNGDEVMGYLEIPGIDLKLVIYHGVGKTALEQGIGHVEGSSLPIGGEDTHSVLAGHRGLPSAKLFTDLDQMEIGDVFYVTVLQEKMQYKVDQIEVVLPSESEYLNIEPGKDYVTLLTCTPYGVNTHRLLVRGERTDWVQPENIEAEEESPVKNIAVRLLIAGILIVVILSAIFWAANKKPGNKR